MNINNIIEEPEFSSNFSSMLDILLEKQSKEGHCDPRRSIYKIGEFVDFSGFPFKASNKAVKEFRIHLHLYKRWVKEDAAQELSGETEPIRESLDLASWGVVAHFLNLPFVINKRIRQVFDFEYFHYDYGSDFKSKSDIKILELLFYKQLYGLEFGGHNPLDRHCRKREIRKATKEDIEKYMGDELKELALAILDKTNPGVDISFPIPGGAKLYLVNPPTPPRKKHTEKQINAYLNEKLEKAMERYCEKEKFDEATSILYRRTRLGDVKIPDSLAEHHRNVLKEFKIDTIHDKIRDLVYKYTKSSLSYGLNIPENFTKAEYCLFRYVQACVELLRKTAFLYDSEEKRVLLNVNFDPLVEKILTTGIEEARYFNKKFGDTRFHR